MSGFIDASPPVRSFGAMRVGDTDTRTMKWGDDLMPIGDSVATVLGVAITRKDGVAMATGDLTWVPPVVVDATRLQTTLTLTGGRPETIYIISPQVRTAQNKVLRRDAYLTVKAILG